MQKLDNSLANIFQHFQVNTYEALMPAAGSNSEANNAVLTDNSETSAELLNIERSLYELSQRQGQAGVGAASVRNSFLSVDSGRASNDTYDTSNSSVSSQSTTGASSGANHVNRLNSTASNCR